MLARISRVGGLLIAIWKNLSIRWKITYTFLGVGFAGLGITRLIADHFFRGEKAFMAHKAGSIVVFTFVFIWCVGLLALLPVTVLSEQRHVPRSEMRSYPWWQWLLLIPVLVHDNNARVPLWIAVPLIAIALLLAAFIGLILIMIGLRQLFGIG